MWALLHDKDNWLRNGSARIESAPLSSAGYSRDALTDGSLGPHFRTPGTPADRIRIHTPTRRAPRLVGLFDFRFQGAAPPSVVIRYGTSANAPVYHVPPAELRRGDAVHMAMAPLYSLQPIFRMDILVTAQDEWSLGEIVIGDQVVLGGAAGGPGVHRELVRSRSWSTVQNGAWRSKMAESRRRYELPFPSDHYDTLAQVYDDAEGGLRPVVLVPDTRRFSVLPIVIPGLPPPRRVDDVVHGHLVDDYSATRQLGGLWEMGALVVEESIRPLRGVP